MVRIYDGKFTNHCTMVKPYHGPTLVFISLVRPHLEYAVQVWSPPKEIYIGLIEKVKAKATKIPYSMRNLKYEARLTKWGINRLEDRRVRLDLIEMYKSVNGLDEINWERNPVVNTPKVGFITRSNGVKIRRDTFKSKIRNVILRNRYLPGIIISSIEVHQLGMLYHKRSFKLQLLICLEKVLTTDLRATPAIAKHIKCQAQAS